MIGNLAQAISLVLMSSVLAVGGVNAAPSNTLNNLNYLSGSYSSDTQLKSIETNSFKGLSNFYTNWDFGSTDGTQYATWFNANNSNADDFLDYEDSLSYFLNHQDCVALIYLDCQNYGTQNNITYLKYSFTLFWRIYRFQTLTTDYWNRFLGFGLDWNFIEEEEILQYRVMPNDVSYYNLTYNFEYCYNPFGQFYGSNDATGTNQGKINIDLVCTEDSQVQFDFWTACYDVASDNYWQGFNDGYESGKTNGYNDGYSTGYKTGYSDGLGTAESATFHNLFDAIADTPLRFLYGLFNFDLFGISCLVIVLTLLTATIVFALIKKIWK